MIAVHPFPSILVTFLHGILKAPSIMESFTKPRNTPLYTVSISSVSTFMVSSSFMPIASMVWAIRSCAICHLQDLNLRTPTGMDLKSIAFDRSAKVAGNIPNYSLSRTCRDRRYYEQLMLSIHVVDLILPHSLYALA